MIVKSTALIVFLFILCSVLNAQRTINDVKVGIVNGRATYLPKPDYPQEAKDFCASGKVEIEVLIGENGDVIEAKAISGDELLREVSVKSVKKAKFVPAGHGVPVKLRGIVIYNFPPEKKCITAGIVNERAEFIPTPEFPKSCCCQGKVVVEIIVNPDGKVARARAVSGHPLLRISAVKSAQGTLFSPTPMPIYVRALLVYNFSSNGKVKF